MTTKNGISVSKETYIFELLILAVTAWQPPTTSDKGVPIVHLLDSINVYHYFLTI